MSKQHPASRVVREIDSHREDANPCWIESQQTLDCILDNFGDKKPCSKLIANYKVCKEFWFRIQKEREKKGVEPYLPPPNEREKIKKQFFEKHREEADKLRSGKLPPRQ